MRKIILASSSPRRKTLLEQANLDFVVDPSSYEEDMSLDLAPAELVKTLAHNKAKDVAKRHRDAIVIGADTMVFLGKHRFGKPHTPQRAKEMLKILSGKSHSIITGFSIIDTKNNKNIIDSVKTTVFFKDLKEEEIDWYVDSKEPLDKGGGYAIQGMGILLIDKVEGDYFNILGLPIKQVFESLRELNALENNNRKKHQKNRESEL